MNRIHEFINDCFFFLLCLQSREPNLPGNRSLSASHFETEINDASQALPSSLSVPAQCSTEWAESLRPGRGGQASVAPTSTDHGNDDGGHVPSASELEEPPSRGWSSGQVTLASTLQESDTGGAAGPQLGGSSYPVDSQEPETVKQGGLRPPVENWRGRSQDPGGPSHPRYGWKGQSLDQGGLGVRLRQAGLTPPSLLKRSASLAKLDHLQLSTLDLSDLDHRSGQGSGGNGAPVTGGAAVVVPATLSQCHCYM